MYKAFYGLTAIPFNITSYPELPSLSSNHEEGMWRLLNGITQKKGLMVLTGEIGTGKTILLKSLVRKLDKRTHVAFLVNFGLTIIDILQYAFHEWKVGAVNESGSKDGFFTTLKYFLVGCEEKGENVVLIIDESQNLSCDTLKELINLAQLRNEKEPLLQIILSGQIDLEAKFSIGSNRKKNNIGLMYKLRPLNYDETKSFIESSLITSGAKYPIFSSDAITDIYTYSKGIPRVISAMADLALVSGFIDQQRNIGRSIIMRVAEKLVCRESTPSVVPDSGPKRDHVTLSKSIVGLLGHWKNRVQKVFRRPLVAPVASILVGVLAFMLFFRFEPAFKPWFMTASSVLRATLRSLPKHPSPPTSEPTPLNMTGQPAAAPVPNSARQMQDKRTLSPTDTKTSQEEKNALQEQTEGLKALPSAIGDIDHQAKALSKQGRYAEAETLYQRALELQAGGGKPFEPDFSNAPASQQYS